MWSIGCTWVSGLCRSEVSFSTDSTCEMLSWSFLSSAPKVGVFLCFWVLLGYCLLGEELFLFLLINGFWHLLLLCCRDHHPPWCDGIFGTPCSLFRGGLVCSALRVPAPCFLSAVLLRQAPVPHATLFLSLVFTLCLGLLLLWERPSFAYSVTAMAWPWWTVLRNSSSTGASSVLVPSHGLALVLCESLCIGLALQCLQDWPGAAALFCLWFLILVPSLAVRVDLN